MNDAAVSCTGCRAPLPREFYNLGDFARCPACGVLLRVDVFPALFRPVASGQSGEALLVDGESSCFYHPNKKAVVPCDSCGRFLCALCDVELNDQHLCPGCLDTGRKKGKLKSLENQRTLYDRIAIGLAALPLLFWPATLLTAPMAIYIAIRYWNAPTSLVGRTKVRFVFAILIALVEIVGWTLLFYNLFRL